MPDESQRAALSDAELALEQVFELPEREALSVINLVPLPVMAAAPSPVPAPPAADSSGAA